MTQEHNSPTVLQEPPDISGKGVVTAGAIVVLVSGVSVAIMALILHSYADRSAHSAPVPPTASADQSPIEQTSIRGTARGQNLQEKARHDLDQWGWVRKGTVARIPISEATRSLVRNAQQSDIAWPDQEASTSAGGGEVAP